MTRLDPMQVVAAHRKLASCNPQQIRKDAGITQAQMGAMIGVGASAMSRLENGNRKPRQEHAISWAAVLTQIEMFGKPLEHALAA